MVSKSSIRNIYRHLFVVTDENLYLISVSKRKRRTHTHLVNETALKKSVL